MAAKAQAGQTAELLLSTSDLSVCDVPARLLCGTAENLAAIHSLCHCLPRVLLTPRDDIRGEDVVLSELLNKRGPAAWLAAPEGDGGNGALLQLAQDCAMLNLVLTLPGPVSSFDLVLVPRQACTEDGIAFACFATRVDGVAFIAATLAAKQVAVVLDLDATLLESEHLPVQPSNWRGLPWQYLNLEQQPSGRQVTGQIAQLPDEPHRAERVHAASWVWRGAPHNYCVRQRLGWSALRDLLIQETYTGGKFSTYVLSLGRPLYIQTAWQILDPTGRIIPLQEFRRKVNSARPDGVFWVPEKTPCIGVGLRDVFGQDFNMRLGPVFIADDCPEVYPQKYQDSVFPVKAYKPVAATPNEYDDGGVLRGLAAKLQQFWAYCYGSDGQGGAVAAVAAAARHTLHHLACVPMDGAPVLGWCEELFKGQSAMSCALLVKTFLEQESAKQAIEEAVPGIEAAVPSENNENLAQVTPKVTASLSSKLAAVEERALRPSSRQDNMAPLATADGDAHLPPSKPDSQQLEAAAALLMRVAGAAAASLRVPAAATTGGLQLAAGGVNSKGQSVGGATEEGEAVASVSIVPGEGSEGDSRLVLLLDALLPGVQAAEPCAGAAVVAAAVAGGISELAAEPLHLAGSTEAEDAELVLIPEGSDESRAPHGHKRDFACIAGGDTLMVPGAPACVPTASL